MDLVQQCLWRDALDSLLLPRDESMSVYGVRELRANELLLELSKIIRDHSDRKPKLTCGLRSPFSPPVLLDPNPFLVSA